MARGIYHLLVRSECRPLDEGAFYGMGERSLMPGSGSGDIHSDGATSVRAERRSSPLGLSVK